MKYRFAVLTVSLGVALILEARVLTRIVRIAELKQPPCRACADLYSSAEIPLVEPGELKTRREQYEGKVIRVRAILHNDWGLVHLEDLESNGTMIQGIFSQRCPSCTGARKALEIYSGYGSLFDGSAHVVVLGTINRENPALGYYQNGFKIECLESVEPNGFAGYGRVRYAIGEVVQIFFK